MDSSPHTSKLWSLVLAGGSGERLRVFIENWLGCARPKQYCTFVGRRSLFQHTLDRADALAAPERRVTIVAREHIEDARRQMGIRHPGHLLAQPCNRGTAIGLYLGLARIQALDPDATVAVYPSDHFVYPESSFNDSLRRVVCYSAMFPNRLFLLGVPPDGPQQEYGWIRPGSPIPSAGGDLREVDGFVEKPSQSVSKDLYSAGALWNSFILAGRLRAFWSLAERFLKRWMPTLSAFVDFTTTPKGRFLLGRVYEKIPACDFSRSVLELCSAEDLAVAPLRDTYWSDWGSSERIFHTLELLGLQPTFPPALAVPQPQLGLAAAAASTA
jgi:mannose-1-phosphate guanylyltransferase